MLFPFVALLIVVARRESASRILLFDIVLLNAAWVLASFAILVPGVVEPNMFGVTFVVAQALAVTAPGLGSASRKRGNNNSIKRLNKVS